jgi:hypothetical protein
MRWAKTTRVALFAPFAIAGMWASLAMQTPRSVTGGTDCILTVDDPIPISADPSKALARLSESIGDTLSATWPEESRVEVVSVKREPGNEPLTATMTVRTLHAVAGQWDVIVKGERGQCSGKVWVGKAKKL